MTLDQAYSTWEMPSQGMTALLISNQRQQMVILIQEEIWQLVRFHHFVYYHKKSLLNDVIQYFNPRGDMTADKTSSFCLLSQINLCWMMFPCEVLLIVHCFILQFLQTKNLGILRPLTMNPVLPNQQGMDWRNCVYL